MQSAVLLLILTLSADLATPARILGIFPHLGRSHFIFFEPLLNALVERGHEIVVISPFPRKNPLPGYTDIDLQPALTKAYVNSLPIGEFGTERVMPTMNLLSDLADFTCENVLKYGPVQKLIHSKEEKFDLIFYEPFNTDCFLGFAHKFQAPTIALFSAAFMPWTNDIFANPDNPAYIPNLVLPLSDRMNFYQRVKNTIYYFGTKLYYKIYLDIPGNRVARKYFGDDLPPLRDIAANTSLMLSNTHFSYYQVRPYVPSIVEVPGLHMKPPTKLPQDIEKFLNESETGVIYFCLGSTLRSSTIPKHVIESFLAAFSELPYRVLWKWEEDTMPGKPKNVMISKWFPQVSVLAHPKVKVFISHGGLMGTIEAVHYGVPMVSVPLFGDQYHNVALLEEKGIALKLPYLEINKENILKALKKILYEPQYKENAMRVSRIYHDRPKSSLDTAVYWTEYVLRHDGARHMRSAAIDLNLIQYLLLDVIFTILAALSVFTFIIYLLAKLMFALVCRMISQKAKSKQKSQ